jgi:hypothetical protein
MSRQAQAASMEASQAELEDDESVSLAGDEIMEEAEEQEEGYSAWFFYTWGHVIVFMARCIHLISIPRNMYTLLTDLSLL